MLVQSMAPSAAEIALAFEFCKEAAHKTLALRAGEHQCGYPVPALPMEEQEHLPLEITDDDIKPLAKKAGLVVPEVDEHFDDLSKLSQKVLLNTQYLSAMNPTAGSFYIIDRMQRHFATYACLFPEAEVLATIYGSILAGHLSQFVPEVSQLAATPPSVLLPDRCVPCAREPCIVHRPSLSMRWGRWCRLGRWGRWGRWGR